MALSISKEIEFDAGHRVSTHQSKCRSPHGHRYKVQVVVGGNEVEDPKSPAFGMLVDFGDLKAIMTSLIHDPLDHAMIVWKGDARLLDALDFANKAFHQDEKPWKVFVFPYMPTAEMIAKWCWEQLYKPIQDRFGIDLWLEEVIVWETPTSIARYSL